MTMARVSKVFPVLACLCAGFGCGGGGGGNATGSPPQAKPIVPQVIAFANSQSAGRDRGIDQFAVAKFADAATSTVFFGTRFVNGTCKSVSQSITQFVPSNLRVRTFYDSYRHPVLLFDELSLKSVVIQYEGQGAKLFIFDKNRDVLAALQSENVNGGWLTKSLISNKQVQALYEARGSIVLPNAPKPGRYDYQTFSSEHLQNWRGIWTHEVQIPMVQIFPLSTMKCHARRPRRSEYLLGRF